MFNMTDGAMESEDRNAPNPEQAYYTTNVDYTLPHRKRSPAELVDTVNRKYARLFGGQDLVAFNASN